MSLDIQKINRNVFSIIDKNLISNACAILLKEGILMTDAGMRPDVARLLRNQLEAEFSRRVRYLCLTHYHADHSFSLKAFNDLPILAATPVVDNLKKSPDWSSQNLAAMKQNDPSGGEWVDEVEFILPTLLFSDRLDILDPEIPIEFHNLGGHTSCMVYAYLPQEKVLFAGDLIFAGTFPYAADPTCDPERWLSVLRLWLEYDIEHVIPGHGPLGDRGLIKEQLDILETLKTNTLSAISAGKLPQDIVIPAPYWSEEKDRGHVNATLKHWYNYYSKNINS